ncbi:MAG: hypothetical protein EOM87_04960, partial [Clostridia bacterium]|nr:hypothetical protein [Clostridia bacterium]
MFFSLPYSMSSLYNIKNNLPILIDFNIIADNYSSVNKIDPLNTRIIYTRILYIMKCFGTDGIRGIAGIELNEDVAFRCGYALGTCSNGGTILLGRDTRESGEWLSEAFAYGVTVAGGSVIYGGILPTPAVAVITKKLGASFGAVISASHNAPHYNGIKLLDGNGHKLSKKTEEYLESLMDKPQGGPRPFQLTEDTNISGYYCDFLRSFGYNLQGLRIVLDSANGAAGAIAKKVFEASGAEIISINDGCDGSFINHKSGALHPDS